MNRKIVVAVVVIAGAGIVNSWIGAKPITPVIIGSYIFLFVLSIMDTFGGGMSSLSGALAMLAMTYVIITEIPWQTIIGFVGGSSPTQQPTHSGPTTCPQGWTSVSSTAFKTVCKMPSGTTTCPTGYDPNPFDPTTCVPAGNI